MVPPEALGSRSPPGRGGESNRSTIQPGDPLNLGKGISSAKADTGQNGVDESIAKRVTFYNLGHYTF